MSQAQEIQKVKIKYVDIEILSVFRIPCEIFEKTFKEELDSVTVTDKKALAEFSNCIHHLKTSKGYLPDVRIKIEIFYKDSMTSMCTGGRVLITQNGGYYLLSKPLKVFIDKVTKDHRDWYD